MFTQTIRRSKNVGKIDFKTTSPSPVFTYKFNGDENGLFYYLGTNKGTSTWTNPHTAERVKLFSSSILGGFPPIDTLVDRQPSQFHTNNENNPFIGCELLAGIKLAIDYWSYRSRDAGDVHIPNRLILSGSNDGVTYNNLDDRSFQPTVNSWYSFSITNVSQGYKFIKLTMPYFGYFTAGEFELYGKLVIN